MHFDFKLWALTQGFRRHILVSVFIGLMSSLIGITRLIFMGWLLGLALSGSSLEKLLLPTATTVVVILLWSFWDYIRIMNAHNTSVKIQRKIRALIFDHIIKLGPAHFSHSRTGDITTASIDAVEHLGVYYAKYIPTFFVALMTPPAIFVIVAYLDFTVALALLTAALFTLFAPAIFHNWDSKNALSRSVAFKDFSSLFLDALQGLGTLKAFGRSSEFAKILKNKVDHLTHTTKWVLATSAMTRGITDTGITIGAASALAIGAFKVQSGNMELATLLIILMLGVEVFRPLRELRNALHSGMLSISSAKQIFSLLDTKPVIADTDVSREKKEIVNSSINFENVQFQYPGGRGLIHKNLTFDVNSGERLAIVGPSGCGKSSIVRLLSRFFDPDKGKISIGGQCLKELPFEDIRKQLAIVSQDTLLFHGNITENLLLGAPLATPDQIKNATIAANAHDFIMSLPSGYDTVVGERGVRLSGGQRQRIAIARALLRDSPILILDEALSSVDAENEAIIQEALDRLMKNRTTLILAHRLSSVIGADRILVLKNGKITEEGNHEELMEATGTYYKLMFQQVEDRSYATKIKKTPPLIQSPFGPTQISASRDSEKLDSVIRAEGQGWWLTISELMSYIKPWKMHLIMTLGLSIGRLVAFIGVSVMSALSIAAIKQGEPFMDFLYVLAVLAPAAGILHWLESWVAHDMAFNLLAEMRIKLFKKLSSLAPAFLTRHRSGDLISLATQDVEMIEYFFAHTVAPALVAILVPACVLILLYSFHSYLALALIPMLLSVALTPVMFRKRIDKIGAEVREAFGLLSSHTVETIQGLTEVLNFQAGQKRRHDFLHMVDWFQKVRLPFISGNTFRQVFVDAITGFGVLSVILIGAYLVNIGILNSAYLPLIALVSMAAFLPVSEIADVGRELANTLGSTQRLKAVYDEKVLITDGNKGIAGLSTSPDNKGISISFNQVTFTYPKSNKPALNSVTFNIDPGKTVALVGPSGAGKSTIAQLLMRFWDPTSGKIMMQDIELRDYKLGQLRDTMALVEQDTYLFNNTLLSNLQIAKPSATTLEVETALAKASLTEFVRSLPEGLQTLVGERGFSLSGGQRQRVAIARAFLKDAPVLILDEATSHLDSISEQIVHKALSTLMSTRTTIIIAHRLSTIKKADLIMALNQGSIAEIGTHDELIAKKGLYANLVTHQISAGGNVGKL